MQALNSFANHVSGLPTQTIKAGAHRFHSRVAGSNSWGVSADPTKLLFSNPSLLSARRGYPHSTFATSVNNGQAPFRFKIQHISVRNQLGFQRIDDLNNVNPQNHFRFNPEDINQKAKAEADNQIADDLNVLLNDPDAIDSKESNQYVRSTCPSKITAGSKGFIHNPSIAGERK